MRDLTTATGHHVWYQWQVGGLNLYNGVQVVNTLPNGRTQSTNAARGDLTLAGAFRLDQAGAQNAAKAAVQAGTGAQASASKVAFAQGATARRAWLVNVDLTTTPGEYEVVVDAESGADPLEAQHRPGRRRDGPGLRSEPGGHARPAPR